MHKFTIDVGDSFDFRYTQKYFHRAPGEIVDRFEEGKYQRVLRIHDRIVFFVVKPIGQPPYHKLEVTCNTALSSEVTLAKERLRRIFNLDLDLEGFYRFAANDSLLSKVTKQLEGYRVPCFPSLFESLVCTILGQQINVRFALDVKSRLVKTLGCTVQFNGREYYGFPTPASLVDVGIEEFRRLRVSRQKAGYIQGVADLFLNGKFTEAAIVNREDDEILRRLMEIKGIGRWSAEYVMIRGLGKTGVVPAAGTGMRAAFAHFFGLQKATESDVRNLARKWKSYQGLAAFYLRFIYHQRKQS
jgi:DNA-3-methyladenine glycosylase II